MTWQMEGLLLEACSCRLACPCVLGPAEPDQGWCSGALTFSIEKGRSGDVDLSGRKVLWLIDLPSDFVSGDGTVRLYIDDGADASQRQELEAIFSGKKGGPGAVLDSLVATYLPTITAPIAIGGGDDPTISIGSVGNVKMERVRDQEGRTASVHNTRGDAYALRQIGFHYAKGWGVIRDLTKAYMWFTLAAREGNAEALENRATIAVTLSAAEIARAEAMAARWLETHEWEIEAGSFGG